jgi:hypothetical protein
MIKITRPDGSIVEMNEAQFAQFYYADYRVSSSGTRIDGAGIQYTPERAEDLAARLHGRLRLIVLTIPPDGNKPHFPIWINVASISRLKRNGSNTSLIVTRAWFTVMEDYDTVKRLIDQASRALIMQGSVESASISDADIFADASAELKFDDPKRVAKATRKRRPSKKRVAKKAAKKTGKKAVKKTATKKRKSKRGRKKAKQA